MKVKLKRAREDGRRVVMVVLCMCVGGVCVGVQIDFLIGKRCRRSLRSRETERERQ